MVGQHSEDLLREGIVFGLAPVNQLTRPDNLNNRSNRHLVVSLMANVPQSGAASNGNHTHRYPLETTIGDIYQRTKVAGLYGIISTAMRTHRPLDTKEALIYSSLRGTK